MVKLTRNKFPKGKQIRAYKSGLNTDTDDLELFGRGEKPVNKKCRINTLPGKNVGRRNKESEYSELKNAKQAIKRYYGVMEKPFKRVFIKASKKAGATSDLMLVLLESRLDNCVYRSGFAATRAEAKQLISHGHIHVNGQRVTISSYHLNPGDQISISPVAREHARVATSLERYAESESTDWIETDAGKFLSTVKQEPSIDQLKQMFKVNLVVELYSK